MMQSGVVNPDSLTNLFRSLSQKRRQGVLEISMNDSLLKIGFHNGKIVEVSKAGQTLDRAIAGRLKDAEMISKKLFDSIAEVELTVDQLYQLVESEGPVPKNNFSSVKEACELDTLFELKNLNQGYYAFKPQIVQMSKNFGLNLPPGQVLLDLMELETYEERFRGFIGDLDYQSIFVKCTRELPRLTENEQHIWQLIGDGISLRALQKKSLFSDFHFQETMLSLLDRRGIELGSVPDELAPAPESEDEVEEDTEPMELLPVEETPEETPEESDDFDRDSLTLAADDTQDDSVKDSEFDESDDTITKLVSGVAQAQKGLDEDEEVPEKTDNRSDVYRGQTASVSETSKPRGPKISSESEEIVSTARAQLEEVYREQEGTKKPAQQSTSNSQTLVTPKKTLRGRLSQLNYTLLDDSVLSQTTLLVIVIYLVCLFVTLPGIITPLFQELQDLTSSNVKIAVE